MLIIANRHTQYNEKACMSKMVHSEVDTVRVFSR